MLRQERDRRPAKAKGMGTITPELKLARGEGCVGRDCQGVLRGLRWQSTWEGGVLADREHALGKLREGEAVSRMTREGGVDIRGEGQPAVHLALFERGGQDKGREGTVNRCSQGVQSLVTAGRSSSPTCNGGRQFSLGTGAEGNGKEIRSSGGSRKAGKGA
jgi:hypothetical protein